MISQGQTWAVKQLKEIADASKGKFEVFNIVETELNSGNLVATISVYCKSYPKHENGIAFKVREKLTIDIPWNFPFDYPTAKFTHNNYGAFSHVQWGKQICLYQSSETEWQPSQGMFGFIERLDIWLKAGAEGQLDPIGMPLHPPIAYPLSNFKLIPKKNTPQPSTSYWAGYVEIPFENEMVGELGGWIEHGGEIPNVRLASVILLQGDMPFEYPTTMYDLLMTLRDRDVPIEIVRLIVEIGILRTNVGRPAIFVLGSAMRGISGGKKLQHLTGWLINAEQADKFREVIISATEDDKADIEQFYQWAAKANVEWCRVMEDRPEIVERRDSKSVSSFWKGKNVAILGCGAIGSSVANMLARAGVEKLQLFDKSSVTPGILVRQDFKRESIGFSKTGALKGNIELIDPNIQITINNINLINIFHYKEIFASVLTADVIIDATASIAFSNAIEHYFRFNPKVHPPIITMCIGHEADFGLMTLVNEKCIGMSLDIDRRSKVGFANSMNGKKFLEEFWPTSEIRKQFFQPEPGCSSPTFRGSFADVLALTSQMLNVSAKWLSTKTDYPINRTFAINLSDHTSVALPARYIQFEWEDYHLFQDKRNGYEVRIDPSAFNSILSWIRRSERVRGNKVETGGVLFGQIDEFLKVIWVNEVSGPPADSVCSPSCFICGTDGVKEMEEEKQKRTLGTVTFLGMWHTHPQNRPTPSPTDLSAMQTLLGSKKEYLGNNFLMMIIGGSSSLPIISVNMFERKNYERE